MVSKILPSHVLQYQKLHLTALEDIFACIVFFFSDTYNKE